MPKRLEHVILTISFVHKRRGDVSIKLYSPSGTESEMLSTRKYDDSTEGLDEWNFMTVFNWGKNSLDTIIIFCYLSQNLRRKNSK